VTRNTIRTCQRKQQQLTVKLPITFILQRAAMLRAVLAIAFLSVRPSVRHTPVL